MPPTTLPRVLGPWVATAIVVGTVIGSGVFAKPAAIANDVPTAGLALAAWAAMAVIALLGGLALAEVAVLLPQAGGNYVYLRDGYGRLAGFLWGWVDFFIIRAATVAALATLFVGSLVGQLRKAAPDAAPLAALYEPFYVCLVIGGLAWVNARGTKLGGGVQLLLTLLKVGGIVGLAALPFVGWLALGKPVVAEITAPPLPAGQAFPWAGFGSALIAALWAYHGWMNLGPVAGEVREPQRNLPLAIVGGLLLVAALYLALNVAYFLTFEQATLKAIKGTELAARMADHWLGPVGGLVAVLVVMASVFGSLNGNILVGARLPFAMADDGLAPRWLAAVHPTRLTPARSLAVLAAWSIVLVLLVAAGGRLGWVTPGKAAFDTMTDFAMFGAVVFETLAVASIFVFRRTMPDAPRPYRCVAYPVVPALYVLAMLGLLASYFVDERKRMEAYAGVGFIAVGAAVYGVVWGTRSRTP